MSKGNGRLEYDGEELVPLEPVGDMNTKEAKIYEHVNYNIRLGLPQFKPYPQNDLTVSLAAGGPSLKTNIKSLKRKYDKGQKVVSMNGSHDFLLDHGINPSAHVMIDARPWNKRFVERPIETCKYFLASQVHPSVFEALEGYQVFIFHCLVYDMIDILDEYYLCKGQKKRNYAPIEGGSTVALRAMMLMAMLGYKKQDIYGLDCCFMGAKHHAYAQPEDDKQRVYPMVLQPGDKMFYGSGWMVKQANDFQSVVAHRGDMFDLRVYGNGLIAYMVEHGARLQTDEERRS